MKKMKWETKMYAAAILIPAIVTLLALAPFPQGIKIIGDLVFQERTDHQTTPASGQGIFWVRSDGKPMYTDESGIDIDLSAGGGGGSGDLVGPGSSTDNAIMRYDGTTGKLAQDSEPTVNDTGSITMGSGDTVDGRDLSVDGTKLDGIEAGADDNPTDAEIATSYGNQVAAASQAEMEAGTEAADRRMSPLRVAQAIDALASGAGGDPTYGSDAGADDDAVYVDENNWMGLGITDPLEELHIYSGTSAPRIMLQYFNETAGDVTAYAGAGATSPPGGTEWLNPSNITADDGSTAGFLHIGGAANSDSLLADDFGFAIPGDAVVDGVEVEVEGSMLNGNAAELHAYLIRGGVVDTSPDRATGATWSGTTSIITYGSPTDDWDGITASEVNDIGFGFAFQAVFASNSSISIDFIRINIYYTDPSGDYIWSSGNDLSDGAYTIRANATDQLRIAYATGDAEFTGDVTAPAFIGDGSGLTGVTATIADGSITRAKLATMVQDRIMGRNGSDGAPEDLTAAEVRTMLNVADGATANTGTVTSIAISGADGIDVDSGSPVTTSGTFTLGINAANLFAHLMGASTVTVDVADSLLIADASNAGALRDVSVSNFVLALSGSDNAIMKQVGATGQTEASGLTIDDSNNLTVPGDVNGHTIPSGSSDFVVAATAQTLTDKRIIPRKADEVCCVVDVDASLIDLVKTTLTNNATVSEPTGLSSLEDGETLMYMFKQGASAYTLTWDTNIFKAGDDWLGDIPVMGTTNGNWDYYLWMWNDDRGELHLLACSQGN